MSKTERTTVKVQVLNKSIYGSIVDEHKYEDDTIVAVIEWLQRQLSAVPTEFRDKARIEIESIGGWEGEHHAEVTLYYVRPETDAELETRVASQNAARASEERRERETLAMLQRKYGVKV